MTTKEEYLGDGLYASFDGWQIVLRAPRDGFDDPPGVATHWVGLEPATYAALRRFAQSVWEKEPNT